MLGFIILWFVPGWILLWQMRDDFPVTFNRYVSDVDWFSTIAGVFGVLLLGPFLTIITISWRLWP